ncbi:MAG: hypothetical protein AUI36_40270 [Cyanobacteria bacterium 13_1_40CM_2_61_4]|nr:MAG: hypothetical protein AUI36_40270 [Cyanobacteria bacterium 13_1_40CM_2_61_4]
MRRLKRLAGLTRGERRLLLHALFVVGVARVALWLLPLAMARRVVARIASTRTRMPVGRFVWAVKVASRYLPRATCLTQALAAQALLARAGNESRVEIGVTKDAGQQFEAHAWVVCGNQVVIGGPDVGRYASLMSWES